jgi:tellurite resistance protein
MKKAATKQQRSRIDRRDARKRPAAKGVSVPRLTVDEAFIALFIGAMEANRHVSPEEAARAHHIIWSMKRFRRKSGETVGRLIDRTRTRVEQHGAIPVITGTARAIRARLRSAAFALLTDLVLADGKIERAERQFLNRLAENLGLDRMRRDVVLNAMLIKNSA